MVKGFFMVLNLVTLKLNSLKNIVDRRPPNNPFAHTGFFGLVQTLLFASGRVYRAEK